MCKDSALCPAHSKHCLNVDIIIIGGCHFKQAEKNPETAWMILDLIRCLTKKSIFYYWICTKS